MAGTGRFVVGGNWKCNGNTASIAKLVKELNAGEITADVEVICAPPMVYLP
jgi:triosephosphate isomerase